MNKPELLAPAGDLIRLKTALLYGADAVYIGGDNYSLRANANNFNNDLLKEAIDFAHNINKKVYITVNMFFHNEDLKDINEYLIFLNDIKVDGIIVSDMAIIKRVKQLKLDLFIILSTQMSVTNYNALNFYETLGIKRVVLARECNREDILEMKKHSNMELEVFIHGAMCTSYSGRCVMSTYLTKRDSNRGGCSQVCRFSFDVDNGNKDFQMCSKDLNMVDNLESLIKANISSFKIEGRMKSVYYIATVVNAYRILIDKICDLSINNQIIAYYKNVLQRVSNRENKEQFYNSETSEIDQYFTGREELSNQDFVALVIKYDINSGYALVEQRNRFLKGDILEVFGPVTNVTKINIKHIINNKKEEVISCPHPQEIVSIKIDTLVHPGDIIRRNIT
ncbi:MAG: U32 family peptidase, partial [Bacilli bacterium]